MLEFCILCFEHQSLTALSKFLSESVPAGQCAPDEQFFFESDD